MIQCASTGEGYRCAVTGEDGSQRLFADVTEDKGGTGGGFRPHELLEAALASCMTMTLQMIAEREGVVLHPQVTVALERTQEETVFVYEIDFCNEDLDPVLRDMMLQKITRCPVAKTLSRTVGFRPRED